MNDALSINIRILVYAVYYCLDDYVVDCYMLLILVAWCMYVQCLFSPQHKVSNKQQKTSKTIHIWYPPPQTIYIWLLHNISARNVPPHISPICIFIPPLKTVLYFVYCCLIYCRELWCGLLGWYHSPPIDDGSIVGAVISNTAYCCVYRGRDGHDGIASTAARQLVWAARRGWLLCCILINCASIVNTRRSTMHDKRRRAVYYYCCVVIVVGGGGIFIIVICLHLLLKDERDRILDMWY